MRFRSTFLLMMERSINIMAGRFFLIAIVFKKLMEFLQCNF